MLHQTLLSGLLVAAAFAQNAPADQLNLTAIVSQYPELATFASILTQYPDTWSQAILGNVTILAPSNEAIADYLESIGLVSNDTGAFKEELATYHLLRGTHSKLEIQNSTQFIPTLLTKISYSNVTGGQRVEARSSGDQAYFLSGTKSRSNVIRADILYSGTNDVTVGFIHIIDKVLNIPSNTGVIINEAHLSGLAQVASELPYDPRLTALVLNESDWIFFAPNQSQVSTEGMSVQNIYEFQAYHLVHGPVKYSTDLTNGLKLQTLQGEDVTITVLNGSIYVNAAKIVDPDYLFNKGVFHLMDMALNPNNTSARPPTSSSVPFPSNTPSSSSSGLSTGAEAGIGVGTAAGALVFIALAIFFIRRHRLRPKHAGIAELDSRKKDGLKEFQAKEQHPELQGQEYDRVELDSTNQSHTHEIGDGS